MMWRLLVSASALLWAIGALVLMIAFRVGRPESPTGTAEMFPGVLLLDWTSGWILMIVFSLIGASASALWFTFDDSAGFAAYISIATASVFVQAGVFWLLLKSLARGPLSAREGELR